MTKRKPAQRRRSGYKLHFFSTVLALIIGLCLHSCADLPAKREVQAASAGLSTLIKELDSAMREQAASASQPGTAPKSAPITAACTDSITENLSVC